MTTDCVVPSSISGQTRNVPLVDITRQYRAICAEIDAAIHDVLEQGACVGDPYVGRFESAFAKYVGAQHCVGVSSGTSAIELTLRAAGVGQGDEVIVPVNTFIATAEAVIFAGAKPVFADVSEESQTLDPAEIARLITPQTKAVVAVHLYGQPADLAEITAIAAANGLLLIEDAAQAHGATYANKKIGSISLATCFSFYPAKTLGAYGEGGAVTTNSGDLADKIRMIANHGSRTKYIHEVLGYNHRLAALQAAILEVKLAHLDEAVQGRRNVAAQYNELLAGSAIRTPRELPGRTHSYHLYVTEVDDRDEVRERLSKVGVSTGVHYPVPLHLQPSMSYLGYKPGQFPRAEASASRILSLPLFPELQRDEVEYVAEHLLNITSDLQPK
jgi:dTDP-4-amino-4,6-dideoxygalactose transaminase